MKYVRHGGRQCRVLPLTVMIVWLAHIFGSRSCLRRCGELVSSAMEEQWLERWPFVANATRVAIEKATRQLTVVVSEMQQQNGELRQRASHLEHELALTKESLSSQRRTRVTRSNNSVIARVCVKVVLAAVIWSGMHMWAVLAQGLFLTMEDFAAMPDLAAILSLIQWSGYRLAIVVPAMLPRLTDATSAKCHSVFDAVAMHAHIAVQKIDEQAYVITGAMNVWSGQDKVLRSYTIVGGPLHFYFPVLVKFDTVLRDRR